MSMFADAKSDITRKAQHHERQRWAMKIITIRQAAEKAGVSVSTLKRLLVAGEFPRKVNITERRIGFLESEVDEFIQQRVAERDAA